MDRVGWWESGEEGDGMHTSCLGRGCMATLEDGGSGVFYPALWALWQARRQGLRCSAPIVSAEAVPRFGGGQWNHLLKHANP